MSRSLVSQALLGFRTDSAFRWLSAVGNKARRRQDVLLQNGGMSCGGSPMPSSTHGGAAALCAGTVELRGRHQLPQKTADRVQDWRCRRNTDVVDVFVSIPSECRLKMGMGSGCLAGAAFAEDAAIPNDCYSAKKAPWRPRHSMNVVQRMRCVCTCCSCDAQSRSVAAHWRLVEPELLLDRSRISRWISINCNANNSMRAARSSSQLVAGAEAGAELAVCQFGHGALDALIDPLAPGAAA